jgi:3-hydroxyisobutyrate dehydrogenase-like beta-hydroxyacid dehydrogenase
MSAAPRIGIVGLGIMGSAYARHLHEAGYALAGYDIAAPATDAFRRLGGTPSASPRKLADECDLILAALPSVAALRLACLDPETGLGAGLAAGKCLVEMSTLPIAVKEECRAALAARGADMLDCPVSGTGAQALERDIVLYASGAASAIERWRTVLGARTRIRRRFSPCCAAWPRRRERTARCLLGSISDVMAGLDPAIHAQHAQRAVSFAVPHALRAPVDGRVKIL